MEETLKKIEARLDSIEASIAIIANNSKSVEQDCSRMRDHIQFIEKTYEMVRAPLNYIKNYIAPSKDLPAIEEKSQDKV